MKFLVFACVVSFAFVSSSVVADTWYDPSFREMLTKSDLIGVFRVVEGGSFKARLVPVSVYKGRVSDEIWVGGFSNRYGPVDTLAVGQSYLLFINKVKKHKSSYRSWTNAGTPSISRASYEAAAFVRSQKNGYFVPTPTSGEYRVIGDHVFIDLAEINDRIEGFPLEDVKLIVERRAKSANNAAIEHFKEEIRIHSSTANVYLLTNYLSALELLALATYEPIFEEIASNATWQSRFTLTKLLGSIKGNESRNLLVRMMDDTVGVVQGEVVRQLAKRESPSFLGPLLVKRLDSASNQGLYPVLMSPVRNKRESGKLQIIETLANLNYKPAIPDLLALLKTENEYVFTQTLAALIKLGSKELVEPLNNRLGDPKLPASMLFDITRIIEDQNLIQCKEGLAAQLSTHNRNENRDKTIALATLVALEKQDSSIEALILNDFKHFFTYYDTLQSFNQAKWIEEYLTACARMKSERARPLVYRAIYEWNGLHPEFFTSLRSFQFKQGKEDSLRNEFLRTLGPGGYELEDVIYFGSNRFNEDEFVGSVKLPDDSATFERRKFIADHMGLREDNVFLVANEGWCWLDCQERFAEHGASSPINNFIEYAEACPNETDLKFLKALMTSGRWEAEYFHRELSRAVEQIQAALSSR